MQRPSALLQPRFRGRVTDGRLGPAALLGLGLS